MPSSNGSTRPPADYHDLKAVFINCTLKRSPEPSHTEGLVGVSRHIMEANGVQVETIRAIDQRIAVGVWPDMTEHGWDVDEWPGIFDKVMAADILVVAGPIWLGDNSSVTQADHRTALRLLAPAERRRAVRLLRPGGRAA